MSCVFTGCVYDIHDIRLYYLWDLVFLLDVYMTYTTYGCHARHLRNHPDIYRVLAIDSCFFAEYISVLLDIRMQSWQTSRHNKYLDINVTIQVRHTWHVSPINVVTVVTLPPLLFSSLLFSSLWENRESGSRAQVAAMLLVCTMYDHLDRYKA